MLGQALLALKRYDEVLAEMRVALELDHTSITAQVLKGEALLRKGDSHGAIEVFQRVRTLAPTDPRVAQLLDEAERAVGRPRMSAVYPAVGFISPGPPAGNPQFATRAYVPHAADEEDTDAAEEGDEDTGGSFTRPTSLAAPPAIKRSAPVAAQPQQPLFGHSSGRVRRCNATAGGARGRRSIGHRRGRPGARWCRDRRRRFRRCRVAARRRQAREGRRWCARCDPPRVALAEAGEAEGPAKRDLDGRARRRRDDRARARCARPSRCRRVRSMRDPGHRPLRIDRRRISRSSRRRRTSRR